MKTRKPVKENKETPVKLIKNFVRNSQYFFGNKSGLEIGPKFVFTSLRVPQIKL
jgi:hypothetical protein